MYLLEGLNKTHVIWIEIVMHIKNKQFYKEMTDDVEERFDTRIMKQKDQ